MPKERKQATDAKGMLRAAERACSAVAILEDAAWELNTAAAGELLQARQAMERALAFLSGEDPD